jgi:hypothetical protein
MIPPTIQLELAVGLCGTPMQGMDIKKMNSQMTVRPRSAKQQDHTKPKTDLESKPEKIPSIKQQIITQSEHL